MSQPYPLPREIRSTGVLAFDGVNQVFGPFAFRIFDIEDVAAYVKHDGEDVYAKVSSFTIIKSDDEIYDTFNIDFGQVYPASSVYVVQGERAHERSNAVTRGGGIDTGALEADLSKLAIVHQEVRRDVDRSLKFDVGLSGGGAVQAVEEGHFLKADGEGNFVDGGLASELENAQGYAAAADLARVAAEGAAGASVGDGYPSVAHFKASAIPSAVVSVKVAGYYSVGDGGDFQAKRIHGNTVSSYPDNAVFRSSDRYLPNGSTDATHGGYWLNSSMFLSVLQFGVVRDGTDTLASLQDAQDFAQGKMLFWPAGEYGIPDTFYFNPATLNCGVSPGDNWGASSSETGTVLKTIGTGTARIWTDVGVTGTAAGTLVDAPITVAAVINGSAIGVSNITLEGGEESDGSDAWDVGFFLPCVKRTSFTRVETKGYFNISGFYGDLTWSNQNTALLDLHENTYGRAINSDTGLNETALDRCWLAGGQWGMYVKGTERTDISAGLWGWGGASDLGAIFCRVSNTPLGVSPHYAEDSGALFIDVHGNFQNRYYIGCSFRTSSAYSVFLDRGRDDHFIGSYGEARPERCETSEVIKTVDAIGTISVTSQNGREYTGANSLDGVFFRVYLSDNSRIDPISSGLRPGAVVTTATGSCVIEYLGYDDSESRAYIGTTEITGAITNGQTITQEAGQDDASTPFYATDRNDGVSIWGRSSFTSASGFLTYIGLSSALRNLRTAGLISTQSNFTATSDTITSINCEDNQLNLWINKFGTGGATETRVRLTEASLAPYQVINNGSSSQRWDTVYSTSADSVSSDERVKDLIKDIPDRWLDAWGNVRHRIYKMKAAIHAKGTDAARWHTGVIVQELVADLIKGGLSEEEIWSYGILGFDAWGDEFEDVLDDDGKVVGSRKTMSAGELYSARYGEIEIIENAWVRRELKQVQGRLAKLESRFVELVGRVSSLDGRV